MPCRSDYMDPTAKELYCRETADLLAYLMPKAGFDNFKGAYLSKVKKCANNNYCTKDYTKELCALINTLSEGELNAYVYNGRIAYARRLADWWEKHQEVDKRHKAEDLAKAKKIREEIERLEAELKELERD